MNRFVWQGGTLVSKAKVTINGVVYEVEPEEYEGQTPLSPENLMEMQEIIFQSIYPVGSIYMSTASINPATLFGVGTWELWGKGKVPVGIDTEDTDFDVVEKTGGEKKHTLTINEMPSHSHRISANAHESSQPYSSGEPRWPWIDQQEANRTTWDAGGDQPHNNLQPYITCYMWKRTA